MKTLHVSVAIAATLLSLSSPARAAIQLTPVVTSGIANATFVGNAGDGSNRLFILEQAGVVKVLQPGASTRRQRRRYARKRPPPPLRMPLPRFRCRT